MKEEVQVASSATAVEMNQKLQKMTKVMLDPESQSAYADIDRGNDSGVDLQVRAHFT